MAVRSINVATAQQRTPRMQVTIDRFSMSVDIKKDQQKACEAEIGRPCHT